MGKVPKGGGRGRPLKQDEIPPSSEEAFPILEKKNASSGEEKGENNRSTAFFLPSLLLLENEVEEAPILKRLFSQNLPLVFRSIKRVSSLNDLHPPFPSQDYCTVCGTRTASGQFWGAILVITDILCPVEDCCIRKQQHF